MMTATPDEMAFIEAIKSNPDDDAPRLIFADWLEERGKETDSGYIRTQVRRDDKGKRHFSDWGPDDGPPETDDWRIGFIEHLKCTAEWWLAHADEMTRHHPIRHVTLTTAVPYDSNVDPPFMIWLGELGDEINRKYIDHGVVWEHHDDEDATVTKLLKGIWPNIVFTLPGDS